MDTVTNLAMDLQLLDSCHVLGFPEDAKDKIKGAGQRVNSQ